MLSKRFKPGKFFVLLNEELGFIAWFWFPGLSPEALIAWWRSVEAAAPGSAPLFFNPRNLPGRLVRADFEIWCQLCQTGFYWYAHAHWEDDSYLLPPGGPAVYHRGYPDAPEPPSQRQGEAEDEAEDQAEDQA